MAGSITITVRGIDELLQALDQAPQDIEALATRANDDSAPIVAASVAAQTPVRTGELVGSERVFTTGPWRATFEAVAFHSSFVAYGTRFMRANPFQERGVANAEPAVVAVWEAEADRFAVEFDS